MFKLANISEAIQENKRLLYISIRSVLCFVQSSD